MADIKLKYIYRYCNDINEMKDFYSGILGFQEKSFGDHKGFGWLEYEFGDTKLAFYKDEGKAPKIKDFAKQPAQDLGKKEITSFGIQYKEEEFRKLYEKLVEEKISLLTEKPQWLVDSYWGITIRDPMGFSLEIFSIPQEKPSDFEWK